MENRRRINRARREVEKVPICRTQSVDELLRHRGRGFPSVSIDCLVDFLQEMNGPLLLLEEMISQQEKSPKYIALLPLSVT